MSEDRHSLAHRAAVRRDRSDRRIVSVTGGQRLEWLQGLLTNDVARLRGGGACYAAWLTPQGRMITDADVIETGEATWLDVPARLADVLSSRLDSMIFAEDVRVATAPAIATLGVYGPGTPALLAPVLDQVTPDAIVEPYRLHVIGVGEGMLVVVGAGHLGVPGAHLYASAGPLNRVRAVLDEAGVPELDEATAEVLRVEAGRPAFLKDMGEETIPLEAGIESSAISHTKGCYVGQEIIVRMRDRAQGRVARKLVGLVLDGATVPAPDASVMSGERQVGRVTSAVRSVSLDRPIALATVHRDHVSPGTALEVVSGQDRIAARVVQLPFAS